MMSDEHSFSPTGEKRVRCPQVLRQAVDAPFDDGRLALPTIRDFLPVIIAGVLMIAATCVFIGAHIERIADAIATSEERL